MENIIIDINNCSDEDLNRLLQLDKSSDYYNNIYLNLISEIKNKRPGLVKNNYPGIYLEKHHIIPRCMGGNNEKSNLVLLTFKEHVIMHCLLFLSNPDNLALAWAVNYMLNLINTTTKNLSLTELLDRNSKFRQKLSERFKKPVVCLNENKEIIKIYKGTGDIVSDNFSPKNLSRQIKNKGLHGGYYWDTLENLEKSNPEMIVEYYRKTNIENLIMDKDERNKRTISILNKTEGNNSFSKTVICTDEKSFYYKFESLTTAERLLNLSVSSISTAIRTNKFSGGVKWYLENEFNNKFPNINSTIDLNLLQEKVFNLNTVICCDNNLNILKVYNTLKSVEDDNFRKYTICRALSSDSHYGMGYYWYKYTNYPDLEKFRAFSKSNIIELEPIDIKTPISCVRCDMNNNVLSIYQSLHDVETDNFNFQSISRILNENKIIFRGFNWYKLNEFSINYPHKLKEYYDRK